MLRRFESLPKPVSLSPLEGACGYRQYAKDPCSIDSRQSGENGKFSVVISANTLMHSIKIVSDNFL